MIARVHNIARVNCSTGTYLFQKQTERGIGNWALAEKCGMWKTQIQSIIKDPMQILADFQNNDPLECKRKLQKTRNEEINMVTW